MHMHRKFCWNETDMRVSAREPDPGVSEAILGIVYSAHRTEVKGATDASGRLTVTEGHMLRAPLHSRILHAQVWARLVNRSDGQCRQQSICPGALIEKFMSFCLDN